MGSGTLGLLATLVLRLRGPYLALTTLSFVPQAVKTIRSKETHGISLWMYLTFTVGIGSLAAREVVEGAVAHALRRVADVRRVLFLPHEHFGGRPRTESCGGFWRTRIVGG